MLASAAPTSNVRPLNPRALRSSRRRHRRQRAPRSAPKSSPSSAQASLPLRHARPRATAASPISSSSRSAALGVVYGDIGTSPLYALRECFHKAHGIALTPANVLGVLSLIVWALMLIISIKYVAYVLRADNKGEGGILALMALASGAVRR